MRKPRGDARLKTLPREKQEQIIVWLKEHTQRRTAELVVGAYGIDTSPSALGEFYSWFFLSGRLEQAASFATQVKDTLKDLPELALDEDKLSAAGQAIFETMALETADPKLFLGLREMRLIERSERTKEAALEQRRRESEGRAKVKERELALSERKVKLLEAKAAQADRAKATLGEAALSPAEKEKKLREIFGLLT